MPSSNLMVIDFHLSRLETEPGPVSQCPKCGAERARLERWGRVERPIADLQVTRVFVERYKCHACGHTSQVQPEGVEHRRAITLRLRELIGLLWYYYESISTVHGLLAAKVDVSRATVARATDGLPPPQKVTTLRHRETLMDAELFQIVTRKKDVDEWREFMDPVIRMYGLRSTTRIY